MTDAEILDFTCTVASLASASLCTLQQLLDKQQRVKEVLEGEGVVLKAANKTVDACEKLCYVISICMKG